MNTKSFWRITSVSSCNLNSSQPFGAKSFSVRALLGAIYTGADATGGNWNKSPTTKTHMPPQSPSAERFTEQITSFIRWKKSKPTILISSVMSNIRCSSFTCIRHCFSYGRTAFVLSFIDSAEWIVDPLILYAADPVGAVTRTIGWSGSGRSTC